MRKLIKELDKGTIKPKNWITITSSTNGQVTAVKEYEVTDEQVERVKNFFKGLNDAKTLMNKGLLSTRKDANRGEKE